MVSEQDNIFHIIDRHFIRTQIKLISLPAKIQQSLRDVSNNPDNIVPMLRINALMIQLRKLVWMPYSNDFFNAFSVPVLTSGSSSITSGSSSITSGRSSITSGSSRIIITT